jgi:predicted nucleic acid-binding protein
MIYFDTSYLAQLYLEDAGWEQVRALAGQQPIACCVHGQAEVVAAFHRRLRDGLFNTRDLEAAVEQFEMDCAAGAFNWLPLSAAVLAQVTKVYLMLPKTIALRSADAIHLACAAEKGLQEIYSNDQRLLAAAPHFGLKGINII